MKLGRHMKEDELVNGYGQSHRLLCCSMVLPHLLKDVKFTFLSALIKDTDVHYSW